MTDTEHLLRGKVARILNIRELVLNLGAENGVTEGMLFDIQGKEEIDIRDPDTNEVLGSTGRVKARVKVTHVQERLAVAQTYRKQTIATGGLGGTSAAEEFFKSVYKALMPTKVEFTEDLAREKDAWEVISEEESKVAIGDLAIQIPERKEDDS